MGFEPTNTYVTGPSIDFLSNGLLIASSINSLLLSKILKYFKGCNKLLK